MTFHQKILHLIAATDAGLKKAVAVERDRERDLAAINEKSAEVVELLEQYDPKFSKSAWQQALQTQSRTLTVLGNVLKRAIAAKTAAAATTKSAGDFGSPSRTSQATPSANGKPRRSPSFDRVADRLDINN